MVAEHGRLYLVKYWFVLLIVTLSDNVKAQQEISLEDDMRPVWEAGIFAAAFNAPEYPAADKNQTNVIPSPYFVYRGKTLRIGDGSIARAVAVDKSWYELDLSLSASFGSDSDENVARSGMPDLDFIFELGPQLKMRLSKFEFAEHGRGELFVNLQTRAAFSTDFSSINKRGYVFQPEFIYRQKGWLSEKTALSIGLSPTWASEKLHDYFYQVDQEFATEQRPAYDAKGGYLGTRLLLSVSFNATENIRMFVGASTSMHTGAANEGSPLFLDKNTYSVGVGLVWRLLESEEKVSGR